VLLVNITITITIAAVTLLMLLLLLQLTSRVCIHTPTYLLYLLTLLTYRQWEVADWAGDRHQHNALEREISFPAPCGLRFRRKRMSASYPGKFKL